MDADGDIVDALHGRLLAAIGPIEAGETFDADEQADLVVRLLSVAGVQR